MIPSLQHFGQLAPINRIQPVQELILHLKPQYLVDLCAFVYVIESNGC